MSDLQVTGSTVSRTVRGYRPFLLIVLFCSLYLAYLILQPFLHILIFAIVLATAFHPTQVRLSRLYRGRKNLAALTIVFIITFVIVLPVFLFTSALVNQGLQSINQMNEWIKAGNLNKLAHDERLVTFLARIQERLPFLELEKMNLANSLLEISKGFGQYFLSKGATILGNVATLVSHFFIMIFVVFYVLRDGKEMIHQARLLSPLKTEQEDRIINGIHVVGGSVLLGTLATAAFQGLVGGIGLAIVGIPGLFWGTVMGFSSLIPIVGTSLVWIPSVVYLILLGKMKYAVFLVVWNILLVGSIDNFLRPFLMGGEGRMSPFYVFLAIIGGVQYFGLVGILYGPLILSFAMIMLYIYQVEYREDLLKEGSPAMDPERLVEAEKAGTTE
ncbi:MAG: AI-2E family transporter [Deltaproteobacteria bacterium]|jgi:predicted PurR-regulated permease PerM|nr:AI-2E family transporter [Deltaproteobacteria bacterium]